MTSHHVDEYGDLIDQWHNEREDRLRLEVEEARGEWMPLYVGRMFDVSSPPTGRIHTIGEDACKRVPLVEEYVDGEWVPL